MHPRMLNTHTTIRTVAMFLAMMPLAVLCQVRAVRVELPHPYGSEQEKRLSAAILRHSGEIGASVIRAELEAELGHDFQGPANVTMVTNKGLVGYTYGRSADKGETREVSVLAVRGQSTLRFNDLTEFAAFWRDSVAVLDTLSFVLARLPGARPGAVIVEEEAPDGTRTSAPLPHVVPEGGNVPIFHLVPASFRGGAPPETDVTKRLTIRTGNSGSAYTASFDLIGKSQRQRVVEFARMLRTDLSLGDDDLIDHVEAFLGLRHGRPVRSDVVRMLRAEGILK